MAQGGVSILSRIPMDTMISAHLVEDMISVTPHMVGPESAATSISSVTCSPNVAN